MMQPLPSLNNTCSIIQKEETCRKVMQKNTSEKKPEDPITTRVLISENKPRETPITGLQTETRTYNTKNKNLFCTYCKKGGHTKEKCWVLHRKPTTRGGSSTRGGTQFRTQRRQDNQVSLFDLARLLKQVATQSNFAANIEDKIEDKESHSMGHSQSDDDW
ncbi:unnamed protein product [Victoria cruziana]